MQDQKSQWVATSGFILNNKQELLVVRRAAHDTHPNVWELPGGASDYGEVPEDATKREVKEETGLDVIVSYPLSTDSIFSIRNEQLQIIRIAYLCRLKDDTQDVLLSEEHSAYQWINSPDDLEGELSSFLVKIFNEIAEYDLL
jgi:8-oxo-dGTP diphosphatase